VCGILPVFRVDSNHQGERADDMRNGLMLLLIMYGRV
jgi:hypothetical protein